MSNPQKIERNLSLEDDKKLSILLRSVYLKGHKDSLNKSADMDWEELTKNQIKHLFGFRIRKFFQRGEINE